MFIFVSFGLCWLLLFCRCLSRSGEQRLFSCGSVRLLVVVASLVMEPGPQDSWASVVAVDQGSNLCLLHWQAGSLLLTYQGIPGVLSKKQSWVCHSLHKLLEWLSSALFYNPNLFNSLKWHSEIYPLFHDSCILCLPPKTTLSKGFQAPLCLSLTG